MIKPWFQLMIRKIVRQIVRQQVVNFFLSSANFERNADVSTVALSS